MLHVGSRRRMRELMEDTSASIHGDHARSARPRRLVAALLALGVLYIAACDRERREYRGAPLPETGPAAVAVSGLEPDGAPAPPPDPRGKEYEGNAYHINQGGRLFRWFNCAGCHAAGGGSIGPSLMDAHWRYGGGIDQIYATILDGRPNGMPAFRGRIPAQQIWEIAAYVRALSGNVPKAAAPSRSDTFSVSPPPSQMPRQLPRPGEPEPPP
ncbi:MAG TPA: c-type cytochrome [Rudaea sp.]|nr:c-type cytochrome [Rudaea sp.]